ncbi:MAG: hypothetical protein Q4C68_06775 [Moraxella sp.]|nr:hypothetical protein [Moraxella sp.]
MSDVNQNSSFLDFFNGTIINSPKAVRDNTIHTSVGFYVDNEQHKV